MARRKPEFKERVGDRIKARRKAAGLTQPGLANLVRKGMNSSQVSRWERHVNFPEYEYIVLLARAFGLTEEQLLCGCEPSDSRPGRR